MDLRLAALKLMLEKRDLRVSAGRWEWSKPVLLDPKRTDLSHDYLLVWVRSYTFEHHVTIFISEFGEACLYYQLRGQPGSCSWCTTDCIPFASPELVDRIVDFVSDPFRDVSTARVVITPCVPSGYNGVWKFLNHCRRLFRRFLALTVLRLVRGLRLPV